MIFDDCAHGCMNIRQIKAFYIYMYQVHVHVLDLASSLKLFFRQVVEKIRYLPIQIATVLCQKKHFLAKSASGATGTARRRLAWDLARDMARAWAQDLAVILCTQL